MTPEEANEAGRIVELMQLGRTGAALYVIEQMLLTRELAVRREPNLGLATTRQLLDEIRSRIEADYASGGGGLDYTTVRGRP